MLKALKWFGITLIVVVVALAAMFILAVSLIIAHGGA
jgi:hypothetical protein